MRVTTPVNLFFAAFHALLLPLAGLAVTLASGRPQAFVLSLLLLPAVLALALRRSWRRWRASQLPFPGEWRRFLQQRLPFYRRLAGEGLERFERDVRLILAETRMAGLGGSPLDWPVKLLIAATAAVMLHGRPDWELPLRDGVTVFPGFAFDRNYRPGRGNISGQAPANGPLLVAEKSLWQGFSSSGDGFNVVIHELAHYMDSAARAGGLTSTVDQARAVPWAQALAAAYARHDFASSPLPDYAAQNEIEFFACASEMFFENPRRLRGSSPRLHALLEEFYGFCPDDQVAAG